MREHSLAKVPVIIAVGKREMAEQRVLALDAATAELAGENTP